jgi:hypothetical protein
VTGLQQLREDLEREPTHASTRRSERLIGQALVELAERIDFREHLELQSAPVLAGSVECPDDFSLMPPIAARSVA